MTCIFDFTTSLPIEAKAGSSPPLEKPKPIRVWLQFIFRIHLVRGCSELASPLRCSGKRVFGAASVMYPLFRLMVHVCHRVLSLRELLG
jgi:hypothetical protein